MTNMVDQATSQIKNAKRTMFDPGNAGRQGDLAASYVKVGDLLMAQGNLVEALKWYQSMLS